MKSVNILGAGNVAYYFAQRFYEEGIQVHAIYNRTIEKANELAALCRAMATDSLMSLPKSNLTIIAISDDHVSELAAKAFEIHKRIKLVHTSGALTLDVFPSEMINVGCIWPLQSIVKGDQYKAEDVPLCIDARNKVFLSDLQILGNTISEKVVYLPSDKKKHTHVAAVMANNFTNHLFTLSNAYCDEHDIDFDLLKPLILQSINKIKTLSPKDLQTGPAIRMDMKTVNQHMKLIEDDQVRKVYREITKSIINTYHENS